MVQLLANISGATGSSLTLTNVQIPASGSYNVLIYNAFGSVTSAVATLTVEESTLQVVNTAAGGGATAVVSIDLCALGTENAVGFSLSFDPTVLTYSSAQLGSNDTNAFLLVNASQSATGTVGIGVAFLDNSMTFSAGTNTLVTVTFQIAPVTNATTTTLNFGNAPTGEQVSDSQANPLPAIYVPGVIAISATALEGDVAPRPNGDNALRINDWVQEGRFVAGLDTIASPSEFQRADCAPRNTLGDGQITVADWVQVGRYAVGLDPITVAGGPTGPTSQNIVLPVKQDLPDPISIVPLSQEGINTTLAVQIVAKGTENALGFSVTYDPKSVRFASGSLGSGASGAAFFQNTNNAANGTVGFIVGFVPPTVFAAGAQQVMLLNFASIAYSNNVVVQFGDSPVARQVADASANVVPANFQSTAFAVGGAAWPTLNISQSGSNVILSWTAPGFNLETVPYFGIQWSGVAATPVTNGSAVTLTLPASGDEGLFRLKRQ
jgi:hypothetical protein